MAILPIEPIKIIALLGFDALEFGRCGPESNNLPNEDYSRLARYIINI
jgi:hypothetical protein